MKKISILVALLFMMTSCTTIEHMRKVRKISAAAAIKECTTPKDFHIVPPTSYGVTLRIMRHENCMDIPSMLMILWDGEKTELNETVAKVIMLMYVDSLNINSKKQFGRIFLKYDKIEEGLHIKFYELVEVNPDDYKGHR